MIKTAIKAAITGFAGIVLFGCAKPAAQNPNTPNPPAPVYTVADVPMILDDFFLLLRQNFLPYLGPSTIATRPPLDQPNLLMPSYETLQGEYHSWLIVVRDAVNAGTSLTNSESYQANASRAYSDMRLALVCTPQPTDFGQSPLCTTKDVGLLDAVALFSLGEFGVKVADVFQTQSQAVRAAAAAYMMEHFDLRAADEAR